ncbi:MAG: 2-oxoacid:acceptor oxidoreductase family protein, partial [archaeon]|nr:2-oxoacid:acceptor oxidoreductase family protein [archaeon]
DITQIIHRFYDHAITIDVMELAMKAGSPIVQNIVILGVLASTKKLPINVNTLKESIKQHVSPKYFELNIKALELGLKAGESYLSFRR